MEENIVQNQTNQSTEIQNQPAKPWLKIALVSVLGLVLFGGLVFAGMQIGKKQTPVVSQPSLTPQAIAIATSTPAALIPTQTPLATSMPTLTSTLDPTANWKTYTNTKYGYTVRYPESWEPNRGPGSLSDEELASQRDIDFYDPTLPGEDPGTGLNIRVNELEAMGANRNCSNLNDCFSKTFSWLTETTTINKTPSTFLGQPAVTFTYHRGTKLYTQSWKYIYFIYKENAYNIHISTNITRERTVFEVFDQILSTFKFLD